MRKVASAAAVAALLVPAVASAQFRGGERRGLVALGLGFTSPSGDLDSVADANLNVAGYLSYRVKGPIAVRAEAGLLRFGLDKDVEAACQGLGLHCRDPRVVHFDGGVQVGGFGFGSTLPYFAVTLGAYGARFEQGDSETSLGMALSSGVNWAATENWGLGVDFRLSGFWPDRRDSQWVSATTVQLFWRF